jgi:hypothetical protein
MKKLLLISVLISIFFFQNCKKSGDNFVYCEGCFLSSWDGYFQGTGTYFTALTGETFENVEVDINIDNTYDSTLSINVQAPTYLSENFTASKNDQKYYMNIGTGERTLDLGLKKKGNEYKIEGTLKLNSWNKIDSTWSVNKSLTFEVFKK